MYNFIFNEEKNRKLKTERNVSFEMVIQAVQEDGLLAVITHPNTQKYQNQKIFVVEINAYAYVGPFVVDENKEEIALKTIYPSRKMTKVYKLGG
jgi:hypothetical protein